MGAKGTGKEALANGEVNKLSMAAIQTTLIEHTLLTK